MDVTNLDVHSTFQDGNCESVLGGSADLERQKQPLQLKREEPRVTLGNEWQVRFRLMRLARVGAYPEKLTPAEHEHDKTHQHAGKAGSLDNSTAIDTDFRPQDGGLEGGAGRFSPRTPSMTHWGSGDLGLLPCSSQASLFTHREYNSSSLSYKDAARRENSPGNITSG